MIATPTDWLIRRVGMDMTDTPQRLLTERLSDTIKIGSILTSITAIIYLYGFNLSAGVNILAYVSFTDYLRVAIGWILPSFGLPALVGFCIPNFSKAVYQSKDTKSIIDDPIREYERKANIIFKLSLGLLVLIIFTLVADLLLHVDLKLTFQTATILAGIMFFTVFMWLIKSANNAFRLLDKKSFLIFLVTLLVIYCFGFGLAQGTVESKEPSHFLRNFVLVTAGNDSQICGELLFSFDKFLVIRENGHKELTFLPSDKVTSIKTLVSIPTTALGPQTNKR